MGHSMHRSQEESSALLLSESQETALAALREGSSFMAAAGMLHELLGKAGFSPRQRRRIIDGEETAELKKALDNRLARTTQNVARETLSETDAAGPAIPSIEAVAGGAADAAANELPPQEMREDSRPAGLRLANETEDETPEAGPPGASHDSQEDSQAQVLQGWRIGERLYGTQ
jgi:hypothetical protein